MKKLTPKQERFAQEYLATGNASEAYRRAYNAEKMKPAVVKVKACELLKNGNVAVTVEDLREASTTELVATVIKRKEFLTRIINGEEMDVGMHGQKIKPKLATRIKASDQLNQMEGVYITKIEAKQASIVELVIVTKDKVVDAELTPEPKAPIVPVG